MSGIESAGVMDQDKTLNTKSGLVFAALMQCPQCNAVYANHIAYCTSDGTKLEKAEESSGSSSLFAEKYEILSEIGSGGMGTVYKVRQILLDKICALKIIPADSLNDVLITRFQREAKVMAALDHFNLGRILDFGVYQNQPFIAMEYVDGIPLNKLILQEQISIESAVEIFSQILDALSHAHKKSVLHRDIKPSNIMIIRSGTGSSNKDIRAILLDFGIAKTFDTEDATTAGTAIQALTRTGEMIGSPLYMSPEQAGGQTLTARSDLYSLGCSLFECLTGTAPFVGKSTVDTIMLHVEKEPPTLKEASLGRDFPAGLERVVRKLLSKDPNDRFQSAEETKRALQLALQIDEKVATPAPMQQESTASRIAVVLVAVAAIATVSLVAYLTLQGEPTNSEFRKAASREDNTHLQVALKNIEDIRKLEKPREVRIGHFDSEDATTPEAKQRRRDDIQAEYIPISGKESALALRFQTIEPQRVKLLQQNPYLIRLGLAQAKFPHSMLANMSGPLRVLRLSADHIKDDELKYVSKNQDLRHLVLNANPISARGLAHITNLKLLETLDLANTRCDATAMKELQKLPNLKNLHLYNSPYIDDKALEVVATLPNLELLAIDDTKVSGKGIAHLKRLPKLWSLSLQKLGLTDNEITSLKTFPNLSIVKLAEGRITSAGVKELAQIPRLTVLDLEYNPVDDKAVPYLLKLTNLKELNLGGSKMTAAGIKKLAALPNLEQINARQTAGVNQELVHQFLTDCPSCKSFVFVRERGAAYTRREWAYNNEKSKSVATEK